MTTDTTTAPPVTACPTWCTLPDGHTWTDRSMFETGDWWRTHERTIEGDIGLKQIEVYTLSGEVRADEITVDTIHGVIEVSEAIELIDQLQKQVDALKVAVALAQPIDRAVSA